LIDLLTLSISIADLSDVYGKDVWIFSSLVTGRYDVQDPTAFIITFNGEYYGHVFAWTDKNYNNTFNVMGIRTSISNMLNRKIGRGLRGVAPVLIDSIIHYALQLIKILLKC